MKTCRINYQTEQSRNTQKIAHTLFTILLTIIVVNLSFGQTLEQQRVLLRIAEEKSQMWFQQRQQGESLAVQLGIPIRQDLPDGRVIELQRFENGTPLYYETHNINAARTVSTDRVWPAGSGGFSLTGSTDTLGIWDGGKVRDTHQEFDGRVILSDGATSLSDHATHVAGTMIASGIDANAKGMSYQARLRAYDWNNDQSEMATAAANRLRVSNHSYGLITGWRWSGSNWQWWGNTSISATKDYYFGFYSTEAQDWDNIAHNAPYYLIVKSAGNDRLQGPSSQPVTHSHSGSGSFTCIHDLDGAPSGYDCISHAGVAKNVLTIGAVNDIPAGYTQPSDVVMSSFSSWGPTDDGRIKPDVVANGVSLYSSISTSNTAYASYSGTSMSSPNTSGSLGLLLSYRKALVGDSPMLSSTLKALVIHTADEAGPNPGPDYVFGWGLLNTLKAAQVMRTDSANGFNKNIRELTLNQGQVINIDVTSDGTQPLRATICWTEPPGTPPPASLDPPDIMLVNDVDLRVIFGATTYNPWILDRNNPSNAATTGDNIRDNVEQVLITSPTAGNYTVRISHKGTLSGGSQVVSVIITGASFGTPPTATTDPATNVTTTSATLNGTVNANNANTIVRFVYGTSSGNYTDSVVAAQSPISGTTPVTVSADLSSLLPKQAYYCRVVASNTNGYIRGNEVSFTTTAVPPTATTNAATNVTTTSATLNGTVNPNNASTIVRFVYGTSSGNYTDSVVAAQSPISGTTPVAVSADLSSLPPGQTYYYQVAALNTNGYVRGDEVSFITAAVPPTATTNAATNITTTSATLNGTVNPNNVSTTVRFVYGTSSGNYTDSVVAAQSPVSGTSPEAVSANLTSLLMEQMYYYRVVALNTNGYVRGDEANFTTHVQFTITVPNGEETWKIGMPETIQWIPGSMTGDVKIELSRNGGSTFNEVLFVSTPNDGSENWTVTGPPTSSARIRISSVAYPNIADTSDANFSIVQSSVTISVTSGWNIISTPVLMTERRKSMIFPTSLSNAFTFMPSGYVSHDTLDHEKGYWLKFESSQLFTLSGSLLSFDTITVAAGWNMIGSISNPVPASTIATIPEGIISSQLFGYQAGYFITNLIQPGKGYWIKVNADGKLVLNSEGGFIKQESETGKFESFSKLEIKDASGAIQTLYFGKMADGEFDLNRYEMPPQPPTGIFDVRFASQHMVEFSGENEQREIPILISSAKYPLTISWTLKPAFQKADLVIDGIEKEIKTTGSLQLSNFKSQISLKFGGSVNIPTEFAVSQNYPNPFNPTTTVKFDLPVKATVTLKVYNLLGQEVLSVLENEIYDAGTHQVEISPKNLASGVYIYHIAAAGEGRTYVDVKKMLYMK